MSSSSCLGDMVTLNRSSPLGTVGKKTGCIYIPCFSMIQQKGGHSLAIDSTDDWSKEWEYELRNREMDAFKPDYRQNSELRKELEKILQDIS